MIEPKIKEALKGRVMAAEVVPEFDGRNVNVFGWVHEVRDLGKLVFVVVRDVSGVCQVVFRMDELDESVRDVVRKLSSESVVFVRGTVIKQPKSRLGVELVADAVE
ncbi:MAG: OB-fold nucleic acid binding domain-containing protein, partial [Candidatus Caldarchaeum sp.]|nr:OB-fold nucleic acid binding domain-containing protein [Candidatus Caldarchaeum sp.]